METTIFKEGGAEIISAAIESAIASGRSEAVITGNYDIERAIILPSDFTLILRDCHLRQKEGTFDNIFTNRKTLFPGENVEGEHGVRILGIGRAILDGGVFNGLNERNSKELGIPMRKNSLIFFADVHDFAITGLQLKNQRYWSVNLVGCSRGVVRDIDITADDSVLYIDGERDYSVGYRDLCSKHLPMMRNADGIDIRLGCHDILIENITGFTEDDTVALTALPDSSRIFIPEGRSTDLYNITVRNIKSSSWCAIIRLLNQGGIKLYNVLIDGVTDTSKDSPHMNRGLFGVRIGDRRLYSTRHSTEDETYNIVVRNVFSRAETVVDMAGSIKNCTVENIYPFDGAKVKIENNAELFGNVKIED